MCVVGDPVVVVLSDWSGEEVAGELGEGGPRQGQQHLVDLREQAVLVQIEVFLIVIVVCAL